MLTRSIPIADLQLGDVIVEHEMGRSRPTLTKVESIEHSACSSRGTHVNSRSCYGRHLTVRVQRDAEPWDASAVGDREEDRMYEEFRREFVAALPVGV